MKEIFLFIFFNCNRTIMIYHRCILSLYSTAFNQSIESINI